MRRRLAVVSGQSLVGMCAAATLQAAGYDVVTYEKRRTYSRKIQWAGRQLLLDVLSSINPALGNHVLQVIRPIPGGSTRIVEGVRTRKAKPAFASPQPVDHVVPAEDLLDADAAFIMRAHEAERTVRGFLGSLPRVMRIEAECDLIPREGSIDVAGIGRPDLLVLAEGAAVHRRSLPIVSHITSPPRTQIAGVIFGFDSGQMIKAETSRGSDVLEAGLMAQLHGGETWLVCDLPASQTATPERQLAFFARTAAQLLDVTTRDVLEAGVWGPRLGSPLPQVFRLQQQLSTSAAPADNTVLIGDGVGTGHWNEGGGMQVGAVCHLTRLAELARSNLHTADLRRYSDGARADSMTWQMKSIRSFYRALSDEQALAEYESLIRAAP